MTEKKVVLTAFGQPVDESNGYPARILRELDCQAFGDLLLRSEWWNMPYVPVRSPHRRRPRTVLVWMTREEFVNQGRTRWFGEEWTLELVLVEARIR